MPPHGHPGHRWVYNAEGATTPADAGKLLERLGRELSESSAVQLEDVRVELPESVKARVTYEETPDGGLALRIGFEWREKGAEPASTGIERLL